MLLPYRYSEGQATQKRSRVTHSGTFFLFKDVLWALRCSMPSSETDTYTADREI
jgi:hypothetical protein